MADPSWRYQASSRQAGPAQGRPDVPHASRAQPERDDSILMRETSFSSRDRQVPARAYPDSLYGQPSRSFSSGHHSSGHHSSGYRSRGYPEADESLRRYMSPPHSRGLNMSVHSRRQEACRAQLARLEREVCSVAKRNLEIQESQAKARDEGQATLQSMSKRMEDSLLTCESLRHAQEQLSQRADLLDDGTGVVPLSEMQNLRRQVDDLGHLMDQLGDMATQMVKRLQAVERAAQEGNQLRLEAVDLHRSHESHDLKVASVQGQIDAISKLVRQRLKRDQAQAMSASDSKSARGSSVS